MLKQLVKQILFRVNCGQCWDASGPSWNGPLDHDSNFNGSSSDMRRSQLCIHPVCFLLKSWRITHAAWGQKVYVTHVNIVHHCWNKCNLNKYCICCFDRCLTLFIQNCPDLKLLWKLTHEPWRTMRKQSVLVCSLTREIIEIDRKVQLCLNPRHPESSKGKIGVGIYGSWLKEHVNRCPRSQLNMIMKAEPFLK